MSLRIIGLLALALAAPVALAEDQAEPEMLLQKAWYLEVGLRDPAAALAKYNEIANKYADQDSIAAWALIRAADCYKKLGKTDRERDTWILAWNNYKEEVKKTPVFQHDSVRIIAKMEKALAGSASDTARVFQDAVEQTSPGIIIAMREKFLKLAEEQRKTDYPRAIQSLQMVIALSIQLKEQAMAAQAQSAIGDIYLEHRDFYSAIMAYDEARKEYVNQLDVLAWNQMRMAEAFRLLDTRTLGAIEEYNTLLRTYPNQKEQVYWAKLWLGDCHRELGDLETARKIWQEIADDEESARHPRQLRLARILVGLEKPPAEMDAAKKDEFVNDEAYFIAVRHEMNGDSRLAQKFLQISRDASQGKDWPYMLVEQYLTSSALAPE